MHSLYFWFLAYDTKIKVEDGKVYTNDRYDSGWQLVSRWRQEEINFLLKYAVNNG